ncbi:8-amino-7-oxononanoate synthase [Singulisphaera acidiphila]|uniref:8-amino-7-ketopelargonate synthase n=1 Tax=Singulisphaera acidiphila (strain ATCC BAA-1392 / DSM 18658 / VKM B-2454 / MOB10) TaxID=886293 RepID=L0DP93_SINAD|nr:8-amino-7-oxononanoate synthase [Singulisphaera acidiphila]AGA30491.1 8-amino-7-oxononanoate synthase [Singulisphaera acidiphila DSM 18658]
MAADPLGWIDAESAAWSQRGLARRLAPHGTAIPGRQERDGRMLVNFGSNDYLGLAADPRVIAAAVRTAELQGWGAGASPLVTGWSNAHQSLSADLAQFEQTEAVTLFPSGFAANLGTITALVGPGDAVYADRLNHACLIDGARLAGARLRVYPHNDVSRLDTILQRDRGRFRRSLIATDGVFSMDGDLAPLADLADLADRFEAMLLVDEAHGTGVFGPDGRGSAAACGVAERVSIRVGTLSKALGSVGGFVAGSQRLIDWLINRARPLIYSTALPPPAAAAASQALAIAQAEPWRRERLHAMSARLRQVLTTSGFDVGASAGPIVPVLIGPPQQTLQLAERLRNRGFLVPAIRPPTVPEGTARLRIGLSAAHHDDDVSGLIDALTGS